MQDNLDNIAPAIVEDTIVSEQTVVEQVSTQDCDVIEQTQDQQKNEESPNQDISPELKEILGDSIAPINPADIINNIQLPEEKSNLINKIFDLFIKAGSIDKVEVLKNEPSIIEALKTDNLETHLNILNEYFYLQMCEFNLESCEQRFCLIPGVTEEEWLKVFETKVFPFLLEKDLPKFIDY